jgi:hypothetical protein
MRFQMQTSARRAANMSSVTALFSLYVYEDCGQSYIGRDLFLIHLFVAEHLDIIFLTDVII